jgi:hypothetical protein
LESRYRGITQGKHIITLFRDILSIGDVSIDDFLLELDWATDENYDDYYIDYSVAVKLYQELDRRRPSMTNATMKKIR